MPRGTQVAGADATDLEVHPGSGNVFADMGLPNADELLAKAEVSLRIEELIQERGLTQAEAARLMGLSQPDVSNIVRGRLKGFTLDRLLNAVAALGQEVQVLMPRDRVSSSPARVLVSR